MATVTSWDDNDWATWALGLVEPLIDPRDRIRTLESMIAQGRSNPVRANTLLAGALVDIMDTLPKPDPWRRVDPDGFGSWRDGIDLTGPPDQPNVAEDIALGALARPLEPGAARAMANAQYGWPAVVDVLDREAHPVLVGTRAVAWAAWRRRVYRGPGETWPVVATLKWMRRAERVSSGLPIDDEIDRRRDLGHARIADEEYQ